jgi:hypothetical protein
MELHNLASPGCLEMTNLFGATDYPDGVRVPAQEMKKYEARLQRSATLPKYDITIKPRESRNHR